MNAPRIHRKRAGRGAGWFMDCTPPRAS